MNLKSCFFSDEHVLLFLDFLTTTSSKVIPRWPMLISLRPGVTPGVSASTIKPVKACGRKKITYELENEFKIALSKLDFKNGCLKRTKITYRQTHICWCRSGGLPMCSDSTCPIQSPWMPNPSSYIRVWTKWKVDMKLIKKLRSRRKLVFVLIWSSLLQLALGDPAHKRGMTPAKNTDFSSITIIAFVLVHFLYKSPNCCFCDWWRFTCQGSVKKIIPLSNQNIRENLGNEAKLEGTNCRQ